MGKTGSLYVVKVRRIYGTVETSSIVYGPVSKDEAFAKLHENVTMYQDHDAYYLERWTS